MIGVDSWLFPKIDLCWGVGGWGRCVSVCLLGDGGGGERGDVWLDWVDMVLWWRCCSYDVVNFLPNCHKSHPTSRPWRWGTVYPKKYAHGFVLLCFVVVMQSFIMNSHEVFIHIHQGCFAGTGAIVRLPQCQWSKPDGYGKISQCITTTKHSKAKTVCLFLGIYCMGCRLCVRSLMSKFYPRCYSVIYDILLYWTVL